MRPPFLFLFLLVAGAPALFSQNLDYASAPREFAGYAFGTAEEAVVDGLKAANTPFRQDPALKSQGITKVVLTERTLDTLDHVTVELQFFKGTLVQISASLAHSPQALKALVGVLTAKYGAVRSDDGGYHYRWFYRKAGATGASQVPDFAIVLASDPVTRKTLVLTYADNARKADPAAPAAGPATGKSEAAPSAPVTLDPNKF